MSDHQVLDLIAGSVSRVQEAAQQLAELVRALSIEAERSENRLRELAGTGQGAFSNGGTGKKRGRPPKSPEPTTPPVTVSDSPTVEERPIPTVWPTNSSTLS